MFHNILVAVDGSQHADRKSTRLNSSHRCISYAVFCLKKKKPQVSYYDDGDGTSSFKPVAALGGAFGWGLKRNVLDIYRYACRNYREGDDIYAFGFSRGAFTARLV